MMANKGTGSGSQKPQGPTPGQIRVQQIHDEAVARCKQGEAGRDLGIKGYRYFKANKVWYAAEKELQMGVQFGVIKMTDLPQATQDEQNASEGTFGQSMSAAATGKLSDEALTQIATAVAKALKS